MYKVIFKHPEQAKIYPKLLAAVNQVCNDLKKDVECSAGYRSLECQIATANIVLKKNRGSYQQEDGAVYIGMGNQRKCLAAAYGKSNHCFCIAMDLNGWFEDLTNVFLKKYGLIKPIEYEPWHVQLIEHIGISEEQKRTIRDSCLKGGIDITIKEFQVMTGLTADGISGPKTKEKAEEILKVCQQILGNNFKTPEELISATQDNPEIWISKLKEIKYFNSFIMNISSKLGGTADER